MSRDVSDFYARTRGARRILVVDLGFLGDSVHLIPALWELKRHYPEAELHTLSATVGSEVLQLAPCVNRAWAFPLSNPSPPWWKRLDILRALRRQRFDIAITFGAGDRPVIVTALSGARHRLAHNNGRQHFYNPWLIRDWVPRRERDLPVFEQRREVLRAAGMSLAPARFDLRIPDEAREWAAQKMPTGCLHLSPSASLPLKEWPIENWQRFVPLLAKQTAVPVVATCDGSERQRRRMEALTGACSGTGLVTISEPLSLPRLAALLERSLLHVGADSGVTHLAFALGVSTVTAYREYGGRREWTPPGANHRQCAVDCACQRELQPACVEAQRAHCLGQIRPEDLLARCLAALSSNAPSR